MLKMSFVTSLSVDNISYNIKDINYYLDGHIIVWQQKKLTKPLWGLILQCQKYNLNLKIVLKDTQDLKVKIIFNLQKDLSNKKDLVMQMMVIDHHYQVWDKMM